jgi:starvation-inducible DNA-binding protein
MIAIGIKNENLSKTAYILSEFLADEVLLYMQTRNAHWNVEGPDFHSMHIFFEQQYQQLDTIMDDVAERIRMLGHYAPATLNTYLELTHLSEQTREKNDSAGFIKTLLSDHESIIDRLRRNISSIDNELRDSGTSDFLTSILEKHEKMAWMLRAHLPV